MRREAAVGLPLGERLDSDVVASHEDFGVPPELEGAVLLDGHAQVEACLVGLGGLEHFDGRRVREARLDIRDAGDHAHVAEGVEAVQQDPPAREGIAVALGGGVVDAADVDGNHGARAHREHDRDRQVVRVAAIHEHVAVVDHRRHKSRERHTRPNVAPRIPTEMHLHPTPRNVRRVAKVRQPHVLDVRVREALEDAAVEFVAGRVRDERVRQVGHKAPQRRHAAGKALRAAVARDRRAVPRVQATDKGADRRAADQVDRDPELLERTEHADVRTSTRAAAAQHEADRMATQPAREARHVGEVRRPRAPRLRRMRCARDARLELLRPRPNRLDRRRIAHDAHPRRLDARHLDVVVRTDPRTRLEPFARRSRRHAAFRVQENQLLAGRRLDGQEKALQLTGMWIVTEPDEQDAVGLAHGRRSPRRRRRRVDHVQHEAVVLLLVRQPPGQLELAHPRKRMPAELADHRALSQDHDRLREHGRAGGLQLLRKGGNRHIGRCREDRHCLEVVRALSPPDRRGQVRWQRHAPRRLTHVHVRAHAPREDPRYLDRDRWMPQSQRVEERHGHACELRVAN